MNAVLTSNAVAVTSLVNTWVNVRVERDSSYFTFYLNGVAIGGPTLSASFMPSWSSTGAPLYFGSFDATATSFLTAWVDEVQLYAGEYVMIGRSLASGTYGVLSSAQNYLAPPAAATGGQ